MKVLDGVVVCERIDLGVGVSGGAIEVDKDWIFTDLVMIDWGRRIFGDV